MFRVVGRRAKPEGWADMLAVRDACTKASVSLPAEVTTYFLNNKEVSEEDEEVILLDLNVTHKCVCKLRKSVLVYLDALPLGVTAIELIEDGVAL